MMPNRDTDHRKWIVPILLVMVLAVLLLLGDILGRFQVSQTPNTGTVLRGWRRWVVENLEALPLELGGTGIPQFSPATGIYHHSVRVALLKSDPDTTLIFTTDGSLPAVNHGAIYRHPLLLDTRHPGLTVIRAIQVGYGISSTISTGVYAIGLESHLPILSLATSPENLRDPEVGLFTNPSFRGVDWERPVELTLLDGQQNTSLSAGLRIHGTEPLDAEKQSLRLYFRSEYGKARLEYPLFPGHPEQPEEEQSYHRLLLQAGDRNGWWTLFRDALVAETAQSIGLPTAQSRFVHLFINGHSYGLYQLSERVDRFFLEDNYGYRDVEVVQEGAAREGSDEDWDAMVDWVSAEDMSTKDAYAEVKHQLDVMNFIDFAILRSFYGFNADDLYAVRDRGALWHFVYAGGAQHFSQRSDESLTSFLMVDSDFDALFHALMDNDDFRQSLQSRLVILLNTALSETVQEECIQGLKELLVDDIHYEETRWPSPSRWLDNVDQLITFVRQRPHYLRAAFGDLLTMGEVTSLRIAVIPSDAGAVYMDGVIFPGSGYFYRETDVEFMAVPYPGYTFTGWEGFSSDASDPVTLQRIDSELKVTATFQTLTAENAGYHPDDVIINELWLNDNGTQYKTLSNRPMTGDWVELLVQRQEGVDLRGWRLTDNDTKRGRNEGSIIFPNLDVFSAIPVRTVILIVITENRDNSIFFPTDDLNYSDGQMILYTGNGTLDVTTDPGLALGVRNDNLVLLAPAPEGETGIDFFAEGREVTPYSFGVLRDGVLFDNNGRFLGRDDGAIFTGHGSNDSTVDDWIVDPSACASGDVVCRDEVNIVTPGKRNPGQQHPLLEWFRHYLP